MDMQHQVARRMKIIRRALGITQREAARDIGRDQRTWSEMERGNRGIDVNTLAEIAALFHVPVEYFVVDDARAAEFVDARRIVAGDAAQEVDRARNEFDRSGVPYSGEGVSWGERGGEGQRDDERGTQHRGSP